MADDEPLLAVDRIDNALKRIEAALANRAPDATSLANRHTALRARMAEAVAALNNVIAAGDE